MWTIFKNNHHYEEKRNEIKNKLKIRTKNINNFHMRVDAGNNNQEQARKYYLDVRLVE